jgi:hypothetical protein
MYKKFIVPVDVETVICTFFKTYPDLVPPHWSDPVFRSEMVRLRNTAKYSGQAEQMGGKKNGKRERERGRIRI